MNQEHFASVGPEENTNEMATINDFAFEALEDRLELHWCYVYDESGQLVAIIRC